MPKDMATTIIRTACPAHCGANACGLLAHVRDGVLVRVEPAPFPDPGYRCICMRGLALPELVYHPDRLKYPMKRIGERGTGEFQLISWEEAMDTIATKLRGVADRYGWRALGWVLGGPGTGTTKFGAYLRLAGLTQSTRVSTFGYGDAALPAGCRPMFGTLAPFELFSAGWPNPKLCVVWGSNPAETSPLLRMRKVRDMKERGARIVVIDPRFTLTAAKADQYIGLRPGTDSALALGMMHVIFKRGLEDREFILRHTVGPFLVRTDTGAFLRTADANLTADANYVVWDERALSVKGANTPETVPALTGTYRVNGLECRPAFQMLKELVEDYPPDRAAAITGVAPDLIVRFAEQMVLSRPAFIMVHMGLTRNFHGDLAMRAVGTLAAVTGNIRISQRAGHRNVLLNWDAFLNPDSAKPRSPRIGVLQLYDAVTDGKPFPIKAVWFSFINFLNQCANSNKIVRDIFPNLEFIVTTDLFMTATARYADIVLPVTSSFEFSDLVNGPSPYLQLQQKAIQPLHEARSDIAIASDLARRLGYAEYFNRDEEGFIDLLLESDDPAVAGISVSGLKDGPFSAPLGKATKSDGEVRLSTPSGKIEFYLEKLHEYHQALPVYLEPREPGSEQYPLVLIQGHTRFHTHSMFTNVAAVLKFNPEPQMEMSPGDAVSRGITEGDRVVVFNDRGRLIVKARISESVRPGVLNLAPGWWPAQFGEGCVNALTHDAVNPVQVKTFEPNMALNDVAVEVKKLP